MTKYLNNYAFTSTYIYIYYTIRAVFKFMVDGFQNNMSTDDNLSQQNH